MFMNVDKVTFSLARVIGLVLVLTSGSLMAGKYITKIEQLEDAYVEQKTINKEVLKELSEIKNQLVILVEQGNNGRKSTSRDYR